VTPEDQPGFDPRLSWAAEGAVVLAQVCPVLVVVDVLRFSTAVEVAVGRGARVVPLPWPGREAPARGTSGSGPYSLSPVSLLDVPAGTRVELASPNGATVSLAAARAGAVVLAGCLRNASAVAAAARDLGGPVAVVAAVAAFLDAAADLPAVLAGCVSGRELAARGRAADLRLAAEHDVSRVVPRLAGGGFAQLS
jgi:2-phosphosulfolactate phosphatase